MAKNDQPESKMPPVKLHVCDGLDGVRIKGEDGSLWMFANLAQREFETWSGEILYELVSDILANHGAATITIEAGQK